MNILYCGDSNIEDGLIISILSIIKWDKGPLNIYVLSMDYNDKKSVSSKTIKELDKLLKDTNKKSSIKLIDVLALFLADTPTSNLNSLFTPYCMLKNFIILIILNMRLLVPEIFMENISIAKIELKKII